MLGNWKWLQRRRQRLVERKRDANRDATVLRPIDAEQLEDRVLFNAAPIDMAALQGLEGGDHSGAIQDAIDALAAIAHAQDNLANIPAPPDAYATDPIADIHSDTDADHQTHDGDEVTALLPAQYVFATNPEPPDAAEIAETIDDFTVDTAEGESGEASFDGDPLATSTDRREIVFIDLSVSDYDTLVNDLQSASNADRFEIVFIAGNEDGIDRITSTLAERGDYGAIHIVSHGNDRGIRIGDTWLSGSTLQHFQDEVASWGNSLTESGDLTFYGCDLIESAEGRAFLGSVGALCDCDVASHADLPVDADVDDGADPSDLLQFVSDDGHVLGFADDSILVASPSHLLDVHFVAANLIDPIATETTDADGTPGAALPFSSVTYAGLWDGVTAVYESQDGAILKSTYYLDGGLDGNPADLIQLHYNRAVSLDARGNLVIEFEQGTMTDSAPIAWQDIDGQRIFVDVQYELLGNDQVGFEVGDYDRNFQLVIDPTLTWNTFLGGSGTDYAQAITVDGSGNVYVAGVSSATWGSPVRAFGTGDDGFVSKLDSAGNLLWNTFLGGAGNSDQANGIAVDGSGNVYVVGQANATWGTPVRAYGSGIDAFAAKLNSSGALTWNTFLGAGGSDYGYGIAVDGSGNVYVDGNSTTTWGTPVRAYTSGADAFAAKLSSGGSLTWNTFLGGSGSDGSRGIAVDGSGNVYVGGFSNATWGTPVRAYSSGFDMLAAKLNSSGTLTWNTFLGGSGYEVGDGLALDASGNVYLTGYGDTTWGAPVQAYSGGGSYDGIAVRLTSGGTLTWNTFMGANGSNDFGDDIVVDGSGNVLVSGASDATWGSPWRAYTGGMDAFATQLDSSGVRIWNTFLGGSGTDMGNGIAVDGSGGVYVAGSSDATWGSPVRAYTSGTDAFVATIDAPSGPNTVTVDTTGDENNGDTSSIAALIATPGGAGISLREAIIAANNTSGTDTIQFSIDTGTQTITPLSALPLITGTVIIDGTTQPGFVGTPIIEINGASAEGSVAGFNLLGSGSTIQGLVINRFTGDGIVFNADSSGHTVVGNYIGTDVSGTVDMGNGSHGVNSLFSMGSNTIGGVTAALRNVISGNSGTGILLVDGDNNTVLGNYIGVAADGVSALANDRGIYISNSSNNTIGGTGVGEANIIANSTQGGIEVVNGTGQRIRGNSIYANGGLGIDLGTTGVTANDAGDGDTGANNLQNFPLVFGASSNGGFTTITGSVNSTASSTFTVDFYSTSALDPSGYGEGEVYLGSTTVITDGSGNGVINFGIATPVNPGDFITSTLTDTAGNTSEFSQGTYVYNYNAVVVDSTSDAVDGTTTSIAALYANKGGDGVISLREAILATNNTANGAGADRIWFTILGSGPHTISLTSAMPGITEALFIDGWSEPNFAGTPVVEIDGNSNTGIRLLAGSAGSTIRGLAGHSFAGSSIEVYTGGNTLEGNYIGTDTTGIASGLGSTGNGIAVVSGAGNTIGGTTAQSRNVIVSNNSPGISLVNAGTTGTVVQGNYVGIGADGMTALGNLGAGVSLSNGTSGNVIGGSATGAGNLISGNSGDGIEFITFAGSNNNTIRGNSIGTVAANTGDGIRIETASTGNTIGGIGAGEGNTIAGNGGVGVNILAAGATGNRIRGNSIHSNTSLGIDLGNNGVTANDVGDGDSGANNLQNTPVLSAFSVTDQSTTVNVSGTFNGAASSTIDIDFYSGNILDADPSGSGEGRTYIGTTTVATDGSGNATINAALTANVPISRIISAIATDASGNSSEFSGTSITVLSEVSGTVYSDEGISPLANQTVTVAVNGVDAGSAETNGSGYYTLGGLSISNGDVVTVYLEDETADAVLVTISNGTAITANLYQDRLIARNENGAPLTTANLDAAEVAGDNDISNIYSVSGTTLTLQTGKELLIPVGHQLNTSGISNLFDLDIDGIFNVGSNVVTISGSLDNDGTFTTSGTVTFNGTGSQTLDTGGVGTGNDFQNLTINNGTGTLTLVGNSLDVDGNFTINGGTFVQGSGLTITAQAISQTGGTFTGGDSTIDLVQNWTQSNGTFTSTSATLFVGGHWNHLGGTFIHNSGTVVLDGSTRSISGSTTFYNLSKSVVTADTLSFEAGQTQTIAAGGSITFNGAAGQLLTLASGAAPDFLLNVNAAATQNVSYVSVSKSDASSGATIVATNGVNGGGNLNWSFAAAIVVVDTTADENDGDTSSIAALIATPGGTGISLREAIIAANNTANGGSPDEIHFNIAGAGPHAIGVLSALPIITDAVVIDGWTEPDFVTNGNRPIVVLDGNNLAADGLALGATADGSTIRGLVIRDFGGYGIAILAGSTGNVVVGNYLGSLNTSGTSAGAAEANGADGIIVWGSSNTIGGTTAADRNIISGNANVGVSLAGLGTTGNNVVVGNYIGLDATGVAALGNGSDAVYIDSNGNRVGGTTAAERNVIGSNVGQGFHLFGSNNIIQGNFIGTDVSGTLNRGNAFNGISIEYSGSPPDNTGNQIGGTAAGAGNVIAFNGERGVKIDSANSTAQTILGNAIYGNGGLGIDLGSDGASVNDLGDGDTGANNLQNFPVLATAVTNEVDTITLTGTLNSTAGTNYRVEFFASTAADGTGYGEGQRYLGFQNVTTDGSGNATISQVLSAAIAAGEIISATATVDLGGGNYGDSSEFALNITAVNNVLVVNTTADENDGDTSSIASLIATPGGTGISLREAIIAANNTANGGSPDEIHFNIAGAGPHTINVLSALPNLAEAVVIDGWSEPDFAGTPIIELNGAGAGGVSGLVLSANGSTVRGLVINRFGGVGILLNSVTNSTIVGNYIGTDVGGTVDFGNGGNGITIDGGSLNTIGGTTAAERNVISGNNSHGISLQSSAANNTILGNYIGTNAAGDAALGNTNWGIAVNTAANNNTIGGSTAAAGNVISGNAIGLDFTGAGTIFNTVSGNYIGLNAAGTAAVANTNAAFSIISSANGNIIGGATTGHRNVIAGAGIDGIRINGASNTQILNNYIGTDATGTIDLGFMQEGIEINNGDGTIIGAVGQGNLISGNDGPGIGLQNAATNTIIRGNLIGTDAAGTGSLGNTVGGIQVVSPSATNSVIGGIAAGEGNTIAFNGDDGIVITGNATGTSIRGNSIHSNVQLGIDLDNDGVTANDVGDSDPGANNLQNFPVLTFSLSTGGSTTISGTLNSAASTTFNIDFYSSPTGDPSGYGEGAVYLGSDIVMTDGSGNAAIDTVLAVSVTLGHKVTATATDPSGNTSEFALNVNAVTNIVVVDTTADENDGDTSSITALIATPGGTGISLREAIIATNNTANLGGNPDEIHFSIAGAGPHTINVLSVLPNIIDAVIIDGWSEPNYVAGTPVIELNGAGAGAVDGLKLNAGSSGSTIRGLIINRFGDDGIDISSASSGNTIAGNWIGLDNTGTLDQGNANDGIESDSANNTIGGTTLAERNVISGNGGRGIVLFNPTATGNTILGNYIGTNAAGIAAVGNTDDGIGLTSGANGNTIGGLVAGSRNIISGNSQGILIDGSGTNGNIIVGNYIGTDVTGLIDLGNLDDGIQVSGTASGTIIGGTTVAARNVIAGNDDDGIQLNNTITNSLVQGNYIGVGSDGVTALGNAAAGVELSTGSTGNTVGGTAAGAGNLIAHNGGDGIWTADASTFGNSFLGNSIHSNSELGIDLFGNGVTANDVGDGDTGANNLQNFPVLSSAVAVGSDTVITGSLNSTASSTFRVEFFSSPTGDASGYGEGQTYLGFVNVATNGSGNATINTTLVGISVTAGHQVSATATFLTGGVTPASTSEFSLNVTAVSNVLVVDTTADENDGDTSSITALIATPGGTGISLREAIIATNNTANGGSPDEIRFNIAGVGPHTINVLSALPTITEAVIIDGWSEPDFTGTPIIELDGSLAGAAHGLDLTANGSTIRGLVINRFTIAGIRLASGANTIEGNYIGTNVTGSAASANQFGILVSGANNTIGGITTAQRNVISGNVGSGIQIAGVAASGNIVLGNYVGIDAAGIASLPNQEGVYITDAPNNTIGGAVAGAANVLSGNSTYGVAIAGASSGSLVVGNIIGTDPSGTIDLGNNLAGIHLIGTSANIIGGTGAGEGNLIAFNDGPGVRVPNTGPASVNKTVIGNSIHSNTGLGIDLNANGVTANDIDDADSGANALLNFPVLTNVIQNGANLAIDYVVDLPAGNYRIEFFDNASGLDASGFGEGETLVGFANITVTGVAGYETFNTTLTSVTASDVANITVTATVDLGGGNFGNTSEFGPQFQGAGIITVTTTSDTSDGDTSSIAALLGNRGADGFISLREAMTAANNTTNIGGSPDEIHFNIAGAGPHTINVLSALPTITDAVVIDGWSEPDWVLAPIIELNGTSAGATDGLLLSGAGSDGSTIRGLAINRFALSGIAIDDSDGNTIRGNYIGTDVTGAIDQGNASQGIAIFNGAKNNLIGGTTGSATNVISGNDANGISVTGAASTGNTIVGNIIGLNAAGDADLGNSLVGVAVAQGANLTTIGGTIVGTRNIISGNDQYGIRIVDNGSDNNVIRNNYIGLNAAGTALIGNTDDGIRVEAAGALTGTIIGGSTASERNVISGNGGDGIEIRDGVTNVTIAGNYIGLNAAGTSNIGNAANGIQVLDSDNNTIGGNTAGARNVISGNTGSGILLIGVGSTGNNITGNLIGTDAAGTSGLANNGPGVQFDASTSNNTLGGIAAGQANTIAFNNGAGVALLASAGVGNVAIGNSIHSNSGLGIDLNNDGVTANDVGDADTGTNNLQNFPVLTSAISSGGMTTIQGSLNSTASTTFSLDFFSSPTGDPSGSGEGAVYLGSDTVMTDGSGNATINTTLTGISVTAGHQVSATATFLAGGVTPTDTSEFSANVTATGGTPGITVSAISGNTTEAGGTATFTVVLDSQPTTDVIIGLSSNDLTEGTVSTSSLTFTSANWNVAQVVTVTGVEDFVQDGNIAYSIITTAATSGDGNYNGLNAADVAVTNIDNDTAGITVSAIGGNTTEASGTATFTVVLDSQPTANVIIGLSSNDLTEGTVSTPSLTFTSANWNVAQVATVTGVEDFVQDGNIAYSIITAAATSGDGNYNGLNAADVAVTNIDNDTAGITVSAISGNTTEAGGTATFTVVLDSQPTANVIIGISSSDLTEGTVSTPSLTFTSANWNVAQVVTVTGVDDFVQDGNIPYSIVTAAATSGDGNYNGVDAADVAVTNVDNDVFNTIVVDTTSDIADGDTSSISALMANRGVDGFISLREAILAANNTANGVTPDLINFNIAGVGPHIIQPLSALPAITDAIILDGTSEPDFAGTPVVVIDGSVAGASAFGLRLLIGSDGSTIRGLVIDHFTNVGVDIASSGNRVEGNVIAFNGGAGVSLQAGTGNRVVSNSIHTNTGLGIDLGAAGVTANDLGDVDTGANNLQNFPALVSAASSGGNTTILGTLNSTASTTFDLHFYSSPLADASGFGEGQVYLATASVTTDGSGNAPINTTLIGVSVTTGQVIAATATDPTGNTSEFSIAVTVASPNPILDLDANNSSGQSGADFAVAWTEDGPPVNIADADATLFDPDSTTLTSLTVTITNLLDGAVEMLSANTGGTSISANYDSMTGVLSLTGVDTVANYQQVLRSVTYDNMRQDPDTTARVITFVANDGTNASNLGTTTITLNETNDDPTNAGTLPTDVAVTEDVTSNVDLSAIDLSDVDAGAGSLTVTLTTAAGGNLSAASSGGVTVGGSGTSVLTLDGTLANLNTFLNTASNITYLHGTPDTNGNNADTIQVSVADNGNTGTGGGSTVTLGTVNVDIGTVNDAPVNTVPGTQTVAEDTPTIISGISVADLDAASGNITTRLQVTNGRLDVALFGAATISSGTSGTNDLTIQGSVTDVNGTLAALRYTGSLHVFGVAADSLTVTTNDQGNTGSGGALQDVDNIQIDIAAVNDAPVVTGPVSALSAVEQIGLAIAGTGFSVSDVDETGSGASATLSVGEGGITIAQGNSGVVISSGNGTGTVTLTGTIAQIDNLLTGTSTGSITYLNASDTPLPSTLLNITVSDQGNTGSGGPQATSAIAVINIAAVNDAPQIDLDANNSSGQLGANFANTFIEDAGPVRVADADATLTDVDSATLVSLQVVLINQFDGANEVLAANTTGTSITANYTAGVLTLSGVDSIANYQQVLRTVTYQNASQNPNTTARIIEFVANDGTLSSNLATATVNIVRQNDAPVSFPESYSVDNNKTLSIVVPGLLANDSDVDSDPLTVTLVSGPATGTLTLDANGSFTYVPNLNFSGTTSFTYVATDGTLSSAPTTVSIEVVAVAAAPIVPNPNPTPTPAPGPPPTQDPGDSEPNDSSPPAGTPVSPNDPDAENNEHGPAVGSGAPGTTNDDSKLKIAPAETTFALAETDDGAAQRVIAEVIRAGSARVGSASGSLRPDGLGAQRFGSVDLAAPVVDFDLTELQRGVLWQQLDTLHQQIETSSDRIDHIAGTATVVTAALSTGYVIWALRGSFLVASFLSTIPTWRSLDPLPIIEGNRRADGEDDDDESLADIAQSRSRKDSESSSASASGRG